MRLLDQNEELLPSGFIYNSSMEDGGDVSSREAKSIRHFIRASRGADVLDACERLFYKASLIQPVVN
ncbi:MULTISPECIES: hypothetical protein [Pseudomonas]|uniref:hypothetical protein n=1 Tax=Pseudomonas TaxID=286 RepID=UPI00130490EC|nr:MULTISPECIES: hypothetical protein [Pseudomonas]HEK0905542.1 hypothetical protein [Pseudomonas putida]